MNTRVLDSQPAIAAPPSPAMTIALLPFSYLIEDFLDKINVSLEEFCTEMTGGWLFGYAEALRRVGVRTVLICFSARVCEPTRFVHKPTGMSAWVLPTTRAYARLRRSISNPYGRSTEQAFGRLTGARTLKWPVLWLRKELAPYLATPWNSLARVLQHERCDAMLCQEYEYARFDFCVALGRRLRLPVFGVFQGSVQIGRASCRERV